MLKDEVLKILISNKEGFISGELISRELGVSRTSVWKAVSALKKQGYQINSVNNRGYSLMQLSDVLNEVELRELLGEYDINCYYKEEVNSTNLWAKYSAEEGEQKNSLYIADKQTKGRGRRGRSWLSDKGVGIWMSLLLRPKLSPELASMITIIAALSVAKAVESTEKLQVHIKWPNDIILGGRKLCGILTEMSVDMEGLSYLVCGIGVNANAEKFPKELETVATSLYMHTKKVCIRKYLIKEIIKTFFEYYELFLEKRSLAFIKDEYELRLIHKDKYINILGKDSVKEVLSKGIDEKGFLVVSDKEGEYSIASGEISIRL